MFRRFLKDRADDLAKGVLERWEAGTLVLSDEKEIRGRRLEAIEAADVDFETIVKFYQEIEELDAPQTAQPED